MLSKRIKMSIIVANVVLGVAFVGCNNSSSSSVFSESGSTSSSVTASDGYIINIPSGRVLVNGYEEDVTVGNKGEIVFTSYAVQADDNITIPSSAIIDRNNNELLDANDSAIGFEMKTKGSAPVATPLTTLAIENGDMDLFALVADFDPVAEAKNLASEDNETRQRAQDLIALNEMIKTVIETSGSTRVLTDINSTSLVADMNGSTGNDLNVTASVPAEYQDQVATKVDSVEAVSAIIEAATADNITIDPSSLMVQVFDGGEDVNTTVHQMVGDSVESNATIFSRVDDAANAQERLDAITEAIDNISLRDMKLGEDVIEFNNGTVTSGNLIRRQVKYAESNESYLLSFDIADGISKLTSFEDHETKVMNVAVSLDIASDTPLVKEFQVTKESQDNNYTIVPQGDTSGVDVNGSQITISLAEYLSNIGNNEETGLFDYTLSYSFNDENSTVVNTNEGNITGRLDIGDTSYDLVYDNKDALSLNDIVLDDMNLPTEGDGGVDITWSSENPDIIDNSGHILVGMFDRTSDQNVTLSATISKDGISTTKTFTVTIAKASDDNILSYAANELSIASVLNAGTTLPVEVDYPKADGTSMKIADVNWSSTNPSVLGNSTVIAALFDDTNTTLTATLAYGSGTTTKDFDVVIKADDSAIVEATVNDLNTTYHTLYNMDDINSTITQLDLNNTGLYGSTVTWESNNTDVIANDGTITGRSYMPELVTMTATVDSNKTSYVSGSIPFIVMVSPYTNSELVDMATTELKVAGYDNNETAIISSDLQLPTYIANLDVNVSWSATGDTNATFTDATNSIINRTGVQRDNVTLSAFIFRNDANTTKDFNTTILPSDDYIIAYDRTILDNTMATYSEYNSTAGDLNLSNVVNFTDGTVVTWFMNGEALNDGILEVTPSAVAREVTVSADINRTGATVSYSRDYNITIQPDPDMANVVAYRTAYDAVYANKIVTTDDINGSGYVDLGLDTTHATWNPSNGVVETTTEVQNLSYVATFTSGTYSETETYNFEIPADPRRAVSAVNSQIAADTQSLYNDANTTITVAVNTGYNEAVAGKTVTFSTPAYGTIIGSCETNASGMCSVSYVADATLIGSDTIRATVDGVEIAAALNIEVMASPVAGYTVEDRQVSNLFDSQPITLYVTALSDATWENNSFYTNTTPPAEILPITITDNATYGFNIPGVYAGQIVVFQIADGTFQTVDLTGVSAGDTKLYTLTQN